MSRGAGTSRADTWASLRALWPLGGLVLLALHVGLVASRAAPVQADLRIYLDAARAAVAGLDPYRLENLARTAGHPVDLPFLYPPVLLPLFIGLGALPGAAPLIAWMGLKLLCLLGLVILWRRFTPFTVPTFALALVAVFGFNSTTLWDVRTGNVALIEGLLIWSALACYVGGRMLAFAVLIVAASLFKLAPIAFLVLLLAPGEGARPRAALMAVALVCFVVLVWGPLLVPPVSHWDVELGVLGGGVPIGEMNPSALSLALALAGTAFGEPQATRIAFTAWLVLDLVLVIASVRFLRAHAAAGDRRTVAMAAAFLFVLLHPRPMAYGFIAALPAALYLAPRPFSRRAGVLVLALVLSAQGISAAFQVPASGTVLVHAPALLGILIWALIVLRPPVVTSAPPPSRG